MEEVIPLPWLFLISLSSETLPVPEGLWIGPMIDLHGVATDDPRLSDEAFGSPPS